MSRIDTFNVAAIFIGVTLSFLVASLTIGSRGHGVMEGSVEPDYALPIKICTKVTLREMIWPELIAVIPTVVVGLLLGAETLVAILIVITVSLVSLAVFFNNGGAAFDNAKKII